MTTLTYVASSTETTRGHHMNPDQALNQVRPVLKLVGTALIVVGLAKFFGVNINIARGSGLELAVAGYLTKSI